VKRRSLSPLIFLVINPLQGGIAMAQSKDDIRARNRALVEDRFKAWRDGTGNPFELLADEATWTIVGRSAAAKTYGSKEEFLREVIRPFNGRMSQGLKPAIRNLYADGDTVIVFFDASGVARDGKPYTNTYAWFLEMREGKVVKGAAFYDSIEFNDLWTRVAPQP
jgi:uncharacterized protein